MATLVTIYWICFGVGLVYVLLAGALGAVSHGLAGVHGGGHSGLEHGHDHAHAGESHTGDNADGRDTGLPAYSPFSVLSLMGTLAGFGAGGLLTISLLRSQPVSLLGAGAGGLIMALLLWLLIGKLLYSLHASSEAHVADMVGLEAEVLTPIEPGHSGEIAYVLEGTRYTAPARLVGEGRAGRSETVRILRVGSNLVYVEQKRKLLA